jgi:hypothetical protein
MEYDTKTDWRRLLGISMRVILALVLVGLLVAPIAVQAELFTTNVVYAWDSDADQFQNSNVIIPWDGTWIPFLHELRFNDDPWTLTTPHGCAEGTTTEWAGELYYGLYHTDTTGQPGFQETRKWSLMSCDRNEDGAFNGGDLVAPPSPYDRPILYTECVPASEGGTYCIVEDVDKDVETGCTTGNCANEIVTTIQVNLDQDCDGVVDPALGVPTDPTTGEPEMLCFYAEARTPWPDLVATGGVWQGPIQARISDAGGDKTVNFDVNEITAVELSAFDAAAQSNGVLLTWETATELDNLGFNIYRADSQVGEMNKINPSLIPSKDPGSTVGAAYSFLDESAVPGVTYYYWLEDVDVSGAAEMNGPVAAKMDAARALPGRPRPAPMPGNAF